MTDVVDHMDTDVAAAAAMLAPEAAPAAAAPDGAAAVVGVVDGCTQTSTQAFEIVLADDAVVQLDDLLAVTRHLPDGTDVTHYGIVVEIRGTIEEATTPFVHVRRARRHQSRTDYAGRRGAHPAQRSRDLGAPGPRDRGTCARRYRSGTRPIPRPDASGAGGWARPHQPAGVGRLGVPQRIARRSHPRQRHQRRGHQDVVRRVPALHAHGEPRGAAAARRHRAQHARARVQRQERGPALPRPAEPQLLR